MYTDYDLSSKQYTCKKCPVNTYSEGNDLKFLSSNKSWKSHSLHSKLNFGCFSVEKTSFISYDQDIKCTNFSPSADGTYIQNGLPFDDFSYYQGIISFMADAYQDTTMRITYELKTTNQMFGVNGGLSIVINYENITSDVRTSNGLATCLFLISKR